MFGACWNRGYGVHNIVRNKIVAVDLYGEGFTGAEGDLSAAVRFDRALVLYFNDRTLNDYVAGAVGVTGVCRGSVRNDRTAAGSADVHDRGGNASLIEVIDAGSVGLEARAGGIRNAGGAEHQAVGADGSARADQEPVGIDDPDVAVGGSHGAEESGRRAGVVNAVEGDAAGGGVEDHVLAVGCIEIIPVNNGFVGNLVDGDACVGDIGSSRGARCCVVIGRQGGVHIHCVSFLRCAYGKHRNGHHGEALQGARGEGRGGRQGTLKCGLDCQRFDDLRLNDLHRFSHNELLLTHFFQTIGCDICGRPPAGIR